MRSTSDLRASGTAGTGCRRRQGCPTANPGRSPTRVSLGADGCLAPWGCGGDSGSQAAEGTLRAAVAFRTAAALVAAVALVAPVPASSQTYADPGRDRPHPGGRAVRGDRGHPRRAHRRRGARRGGAGRRRGRGRGGAVRLSGALRCHLPARAHRDRCRRRDQRRPRAGRLQPPPAGGDGHPSPRASTSRWPAPTHRGDPERAAGRDHRRAGVARRARRLDGRGDADRSRGRDGRRLPVAGARFGDRRDWSERRSATTRPWPASDWWLDAARDYRRAVEAGAGLRRDLQLEAAAKILAGGMPVLLAANGERDIRNAVEWARGRGLDFVIAGGREAWKIATGWPSAMSPSSSGPPSRCRPAPTKPTTRPTRTPAGCTRRESASPSGRSTRPIPEPSPTRRRRRSPTACRGRRHWPRLRRTRPRCWLRRPARDDPGGPHRQPHRHRRRPPRHPHPGRRDVHPRPPREHRQPAPVAVRALPRAAALTTATAREVIAPLFVTPTCRPSAASGPTRIGPSGSIIRPGHVLHWRCPLRIPHRPRSPPLTAPTPFSLPAPLPSSSG